MRVIEITEDKISDLAEHVGKMLKYGGKAMECLEELQGRGGFGERWDDDYRRREEERRRMEMEGYGQRGDYGGGYGNREGYGDRRGVPGTGPYSRFR